MTTALHTDQSAHDPTHRPLRAVSGTGVPTAQPAARPLSFRKERALLVRSAVQYGAGGAAKVDALAALLGMARGRVARCLSPHYPDAFSDAHFAVLASEWPALLAVRAADPVMQRAA